MGSTMCFVQGTHVQKIVVTYSSALWKRPLLTCRDTFRGLKILCSQGTKPDCLFYKTRFLIFQITFVQFLSLGHPVFLSHTSRCIPLLHSSTCHRHTKFCRISYEEFFFSISTRIVLIPRAITVHTQFLSGIFGRSVYRKYVIRVSGCKFFLSL